MQAAERIDTSPLGRAETAVEAAVRGLESTLRGRGGLGPAAVAEAGREARREAWRAILSGAAAVPPGARLRAAALRSAAEALRRNRPASAEVAPTPIPEGLDAAALRGALAEVIPGRRSVAGLHLRGYGPEEMAALYGLDDAEMRSRFGLALENLRSSVHRRAQRMGRASWSRALESGPIEATRGMLRERPDPDASRLRCPAPADLAEAVNGTHFRGGREAALDHAAACDPCAAELRVLLALRLEAPVDDLDGLDAGALRAAARRRPDLQDLAGEAPPVPRRRRRLWPWLLLAGALAAALAVLW
jgi:hypothetical protein